MNYGEIKKTDIANGIGVRVTLFVSGCTRHCKNCFNAETWDFNYGKPFTKETEDYYLLYNKNKSIYISFEKEHKSFYFESEGKGKYKFLPNRVLLQPPLIILPYAVKIK